MWPLSRSPHARSRTAFGLSTSIDVGDGCGASKSSKACATVAAPHGQDAGMREIVRLVARLDCIGDQLDAVADELQGLLETVPEATYWRTLPGLDWVSVAALIAENWPLRSLSSRSTAGHAGGPPPVAPRVASAPVARRSRNADGHSCGPSSTWPHGRRGSTPPDQSARRASHAASDTAAALVAGVRRV